MGEKFFWKWDIFIFYAGAMLLLLLVLPALLPGIGETPPEEHADEIRSPLLPTRDGFLTVQVYVKEWNELVEMDLEIYLAGVVAAEMPASFHYEALKAQAIVARTYAMQKMVSGGGRGCSGYLGADLCTDSTCCQAWDSSGAEVMARQEIMKLDEGHFYKRVSEAVEYTQGMVLIYNGALIEAVYHSTCGGMTAAASEVWGQDFPYLQPVKDLYCTHSPYFRSEIRMEQTDFLQSMGISPENEAIIPVLAGHEPLLEVIQQGASGRNTLLRLPYPFPEHSLRGIEFRSRAGLPSTYFDWELEKNEIVFYTRGFGHGVGLCQYGADGMARAGMDYREILEHYYRGAVVDE